MAIENNGDCDYDDDGVDKLMVLVVIMIVIVMVNSLVMKKR